MSLTITIYEKNEIEKFVLVNLIGLTEALLIKKITIADAENALFSPLVVDKLEKNNVSREIIELIELGCELEDVESLIPENLEESILEIKNKAIKLFSDEHILNSYGIKKWIDNN